MVAWLVQEGRGGEGGSLPTEALYDKLSYAQLVLGMHRVLRALHFLHVHARVSHNALSLASVFVHYDADGSLYPHFRLGGLHHCDPVPSAAAVAVYPEPPECPLPKAKAASLPLHSRDVWHFAFLLQQLLESSEPRAAAVGALCKVLRSEQPAERPTAEAIMAFPFFSADPVIQMVSFLESYRAAPHAARVEFFTHLPHLMAQLSDDARDLRFAVLPLLTQPEVLVDPCCEGFLRGVWANFPTSKVAQYFVMQLVDMLGSQERARRGAAMGALGDLLPALHRDAALYAASLDPIVARVLECFLDTDRHLNTAALRALVMLCRFWVRTESHASLARVNADFLPILEQLAVHDADALVRAQVCECAAELFALYTGINGLLAIGIVTAGLRDADDVVQLAAVRGIASLTELLPSVIVVDAVLPSLVRLLLSRSDTLRHECAEAHQRLVARVVSGWDRHEWPTSLPGCTPPPTGGAMSPLGKSSRFQGSTLGAVGGDNSAAVCDERSVLQDSTGDVGLFVGLTIAPAEAPPRPRAPVAVPPPPPTPSAADAASSPVAAGVVVAAATAPMGVGPLSSVAGSAPSLGARLAEPAVAAETSRALVLPKPAEPRAPAQAAQPETRSTATQLPSAPPSPPPQPLPTLDDLLVGRRKSSSEDEVVVATGASWMLPVGDGSGDDDDDDASDEDANTAFDAWRTVNKAEMFGSSAPSAVPKATTAPAVPPAAPHHHLSLSPVEDGVLDDGGAGWGDVEFALPLAAVEPEADGWGADALALPTQPQAVEESPIGVAPPQHTDGWGGFSFDDEDDEEQPDLT